MKTLKMLFGTEPAKRPLSEVLLDRILGFVLNAVKWKWDSEIWEPGK